MTPKFTVERGHIAFGPPWYLRVKVGKQEDLWPCLSRKDAAEMIPIVQRQIEQAESESAELQQLQHLREIWERFD